MPWERRRSFLVPNGSHGCTFEDEYSRGKCFPGNYLLPLTPLPAGNLTGIRFGLQNFPTNCQLAPTAVSGQLLQIGRNLDHEMNGSMHIDVILLTVLYIRNTHELCSDHIDPFEEMHCNSRICLQGAIKLSYLKFEGIFNFMLKIRETIQKSNVKARSNAVERKHRGQ